MLHDPEIGSHIVLQRDLAQPVKSLRHFYAWPAKEPPLYRAAIRTFIGQFLNGNIAWDQKKFIMAEFKRMRKILMLITSVRVKIQLNL